jgi:hypothetical protein
MSKVADIPSVAKKSDVAESKAIAGMFSSVASNFSNQKTINWKKKIQIKNEKQKNLNFASLIIKSENHFWSKNHFWSDTLRGV